MTEHQRFMLHELMEDLEYVEGKIARIEETIQARMAPHQEVLNRLNTIPGVNRLDPPLRNGRNVTEDFFNSIGPFVQRAASAAERDSRGHN